MSEEENKDQNEDKEEVELHFSFTGEGDTLLQVEFADGIRALPDHITAALGGAEKIRKIAPGLKQKTYGEFISAVQKLKQKQELNNFQKNFITLHFGRSLFK